MFIFYVEITEMTQILTAVSFVFMKGAGGTMSGRALCVVGPS